MRVFPKRLSLLIAVLIGLIVGIVCEEKIEVPPGVTELNDSNIESFVKENSIVLVIFYDLSEISKRIIQGLGEVVSGIEEENGKGKIALVNYAESELPRKLFIRSSPLLVFFRGSINEYQEYPRHLTGLERQSMISIILSKDNSPFIELDSRSSESLENAKIEFNLEGKISRSNVPVLVYYGKPNTRRTEVVKNTLIKLKDYGVSVKSYIVYVKLKADIALHIYRLPDADREDRVLTNPKQLYVTKKRILGLLEWNEQILSVYIESCIRPYVSFNGNELKYIHKSSNSLITYLEGSDALDMHGPGNVKYLDSESMESLRAIAKANFFPENPDKDLLVALVLPGLEQKVEEFTGFIRNDHVEKGTFLLKLRSSKFNPDDESGETTKYLLTKEDIKEHGLDGMISKARSGKVPVFYKCKRAMQYSKVSTTFEQYFTSPFNFLDLTPLTIMELLNDRNASILVMFYTELCSNCKNLIQLWSSLSSRIASNLTKDSKFRAFVAAFDLELNDNPTDIIVDEIPVVYYFPFGDNKISNKIILSENYLTFEVLSSFLEDKILLASDSEAFATATDNQGNDQGNTNTYNQSPQVKDEL